MGTSKKPGDCGLDKDCLICCAGECVFVKLTKYSSTLDEEMFSLSAPSVFLERKNNHGR